MTSHVTLPLELVEQIIDELGKTCSKGGASACAALRACSLVARGWTPRSRMHIFKRVEIRAQDDEFSIIPPASILSYVRELEVSHLGWRPFPATPIVDTLKAFVTAPIKHLKIAGVQLSDKRTCLEEFLDAHSDTIRRVVLESCSLSRDNIFDLVSGRYHLRSLYLDNCTCSWVESLAYPAGAGKPAILQSMPSELDLHIYGGDPIDGCSTIFYVIIGLQRRYSTLDVEHVAGDGTTEAINKLLELNGDVLSSLCVRVWAVDIDFNLKPEDLFSLEHCSNLSTLTLDMEYSESLVIQDTAFILKTLSTERVTRLRKIVLETRYLDESFSEDDPVDVEVTKDKDNESRQYEGEEEDARVKWVELDAILSKLAKVFVDMRGERLTFTLVVLKSFNNEELMPTVKERMPKLLPRFDELGRLRVYYGRGGRRRSIL